VKSRRRQRKEKTSRETIVSFNPVRDCQRACQARETIVNWGVPHAGKGQYLEREGNLEGERHLCAASQKKKKQLLLGESGGQKAKKTSEKAGVDAPATYLK